MYIPHQINNESLSLTIEGKRHLIPSSALNFHEVRKALLEGNHEIIPDILDAGVMIGTISCGDVTCVKDKVLYKNKEIHNSASKKLLNLMGQGLSMDGITVWLKFLDKLMSNPSLNCREQAYNFLEHGGMPITENGNIVGYKGVASDYKDKYSGTIDNSPGANPTMPRSDVDDNVNNGCSKGLHVGTLEYADSWAGPEGRVMEVEFNPAHMVSVPHDCQHAKLRVTEYHVVKECFDRKLLDDSVVYKNHTNENSTTVNTNPIVDLVYKKDGSMNAIKHDDDGNYDIGTYEVREAFMDAGLEPPEFEYDNENDDLVAVLPWSEAHSQ